MKIKTAKRNTGLYLFSLHVPLILLLLLLVGVASGTILTANRKSAKQHLSANNNVLGEEDEKDSDDHESNDDKEDENSDDHEDNEDNDREDDSKDSEDRETEDHEIKEEDRTESKRTTTTAPSRTTVTSKVENDDHDAAEGDDLNESDDDSKETEDDLGDVKEHTIISTVTNVDGTITKTFKKTEDGETEMKALTYDANGKLIKKAELNADGTVKEEKLVGSESKDEDKSKDEAENENEDNEKEDSDKDEFKLVYKPGSEQIESSTFGKLLKAKVKQEIEDDARLGSSVQKLEIEVKTEQGKIKYEGVASSTEKLFGLFNIEISKDVEIDPTTGEIVSVNQSFWSKILGFFSF